jgi:hypothetical protein
MVDKAVHRRDGHFATLHGSWQVRRTIMEQNQVDQSLKWGIIFSILWLAGIGSFIALIKGLKARKAIAQSEGALSGTGRAWWCIVVGGLGFAFWLPVIVAGISNQF